MKYNTKTKRKGVFINEKNLSLSLFIILCFSIVACDSRVSADDAKRAAKHMESHGYEDTFEYRRSMKMNYYNYDIAALVQAS